MAVTDNSVIRDQLTAAGNQSCPQVSVPVLTYNASWDRVRATLNSIILQKGIGFEVIVSDDCSRDNHFDEIRDFFRRNSFTNYQLISHEHNLGTVKNLLDAASHASADYIKAIGQGDMLFDEYTLRDVYEDFIATGASVSGSHYVSFKNFQVPLELSPTGRMPQDPDVYREGSPEQKKYSLVVHRNYIHGPTLIYKREVLMHYLSLLAQAGIIYAEDIVPWVMAGDEEEISFLNRTTIYYEAEVGVATHLARFMHIDHKATLDLIMNRIKDKDAAFAEALQEPEQRLERIIAGEDGARAKFERRQRIKDALGFFQWFIVIPLRILRAIKRLAVRLLFGKKEEKKFFYTETNVSTDFANLCMTRK